MPTEKQLEARKLREQGLSLSEIGRQLGISTTAVSRRLYGRSRRGTTEVGFVNKNGQRVIERREWERGPEMQIVHVLKCEHCGHEYKCYGGDIHQSLCAECQRLDGGRPAEGPPM